MKVAKIYLIIMCYGVCYLIYSFFYTAEVLIVCILVNKSVCHRQRQKLENFTGMLIMVSTTVLCQK